MEKLLTEVCNIQYGYPFDSSKFSETEGVPLIRIRDVTRGYSETFTTEEYKSEYLVYSGDLLIGMDGEFNIARWGEIPALLNQRVCRLIPSKAIDKGYLYYYMPTALKEIEAKTPFVTVKHLSAKELNKIKIPLPPLDEQRKIAAVLDKVSDLIAKRRQQLDKLNELIKARFVEMFGDPVENPMSWDKIALGKRCDIVTGNTPSRAEPENYGNFIEWIKSDNINTPAVLLTEAQEYLSETGFHKCRFVEAGSLLMTCIAGSINCIGNVAVTDRRVAFNQQINAIVPKQDDVLYLYWLMLLSKPAIHSTINMALKGILSKGQLSEMVFPFPPIKLQNQFAAFVEQTEKTKTTISKSLEKLETLKKALMQEYFG